MNADGVTSKICSDFSTFPGCKTVISTSTNSIFKQAMSCNEQIVGKFLIKKMGTLYLSELREAVLKLVTVSPALDRLILQSDFSPTPTSDSNSTPGGLLLMLFRTLIFLFSLNLNILLTLILCIS